jgi:NUMOD4 motif/HNH endonuclease
MTEQMALFYAEEWRSVVGYEGFYEVSDQGRIRSVERVVQVTNHKEGQTQKRLRAKILNPTANNGGHLYVSLCKQGRQERWFVHHLVLTAFVGPCPPDKQGLHWTDVPSDNRLPNLRWGTYSENAYDKVRNGRHHFANRTHCKSGHEFTAENTYVYRGGRFCRECARGRNREYEQRQRRSQKAA